MSEKQDCLLFSPWSPNFDRESFITQKKYAQIVNNIIEWKVCEFCHKEIGNNKMCDCEKSEYYLLVEQEDKLLKTKLEEYKSLKNSIQRLISKNIGLFTIEQRELVNSFEEYEFIDFEESLFFKKEIEKEINKLKKLIYAFQAIVDNYEEENKEGHRDRQDVYE